MDGGIWTVTTESLGKGQHAQRQSMWTVCARRKCPGSGRCAQHCVSTCSWLHSAVVMGLHWVAVTWAQPSPCWEMQLPLLHHSPTDLGDKLIDAVGTCSVSEQSSSSVQIHGRLKHGTTPEMRVRLILCVQIGGFILV